jgi:hypothetical protein
MGLQALGVAMMYRITSVLVLLSILTLGLVIGIPQHSSASTLPTRIVAMNWAISHETGHWYCWGGAGPSCYDCSGAVVAAYAHAGIALPHSTYMMLANRHLRWIPASLARRGDLAFYGSGHVELLTRWWHTTFGAQDFGTRVGWHKWGFSWVPTMFFRVVR